MFNLHAGALLCLIIIHSGYSMIDLEDVESIFSITENVVSTFSKIPEYGDMLSEHGSDIAVPFSKRQKQLKPMLKKFAQVTRLLKDIDIEMKKNHAQTISTLQHSLPIAFRYELRLDSIEDSITMIDLYFQNFQAYTNLEKEQIQQTDEVQIINMLSDPTQASNFSKYSQFTLENFATSLTSHEPTSVRGLLERIHEMAVPSSRDSVRLFMRESIFKTVINSFEESKPSQCDSEMSPQQLLYNLFSTLQVTQIKGYTMMQFAWMLLHTYGKGNFTQETLLFQEQFKTRFAQQINIVKEVMKKADNMMYRCDPKVHVEGDTFAQMTQLLQGYLVNEVDLNNKESCLDNCAYYAITKQYSCFNNEFCGRQDMCRGKIYNCQFFDSDMSICASSSRNNNASRRYDYIQYENGLLLGKKTHCKNFEDKVDSWWRFLLYHCSYCMCLCDNYQSVSTHRYWSLRPVESDVENNKIVVGIKFVKLDKVMYLQIQEATLLPKLNVNASTAEWQPVSRFRVTDFKVVEGLDYHTMTFEKRGLDLDDLKLKKNYVLTGLRFKVLGNHLNMEVRATPFNFSTGQLYYKKSEWYGNDNTDASSSPRYKLDMENRDVPTLSKSPSYIDSEHDSYLLFTNTGFDSDVAQTTVPFIDTQIVSTNPLTPLSGAGLFHKGSPGFGGYVGVKIFTYDVSEYLSSHFLTDRTD